MNTFLPYPNFKKSARCLDWQRLGSQRRECLMVYQTITLGTGWIHHPCAKMWWSYPKHLILYSIEICKEWQLRGYKDSLLDFFEYELKKYEDKTEPTPFWLGYRNLHNSHKANLLRKSSAYYEQFKWNVIPQEGYYWPMTKIQEEYNNLVELAKSANIDYYLHNNPKLSDQEFDMVIRRIEDIERQFPYMVNENSPTKMVGGTLSDKFRKEKHTYPMLSLKNAFTIDEVEKFIAEVKEEDPAALFIAQPKFDGLSLSLVYYQGDLIKAITRGSGKEGEMVLENAKTVKGIPHKLKEKLDLEIRGEILLTKAQLARVNEEQRKKDEPEYSNCRNAASGSLRNLDSKITASRGLIFIAYGTGNLESNITHSKLIDLFKRLDFLTPDNQIIFDINKTITDFKNEKHNLPYDVDGLVIKVNSLSLCNSLGSHTKYPRWAIAYKYPSEHEFTIIKDVIWETGRTGAVTPTAILEPVSIGGSKISRCTLNNYQYIQSKGIKIGSRVSIKKAGEVIPQIICVCPDEEKREEIVIKEPTECPECKSTLLKKGKLVFCMNENCSSRIINLLIHFTSKDGFNIQGLGEKTIGLLSDIGLIVTWRDIFELESHKEKLALVDGLGESSVENLVDSILKSKTIELSKFIYSLGIPSLGRSASHLVSLYYGNINNFLNCTEKSLTNIQGIAEPTAKEIKEFLNKKMEDILYLLDTPDLNIINPNNITKQLEGKTIVFTGTLKSPRDYYINLVRQAGGKIASSVSKNTSYLVCGESPGSKKKEASVLNILIISEDDLIKMI